MPASPPTSPPKKKSKEDLEKEQQQAKEQLEQILKSSQPKNARQGLTNGVNNVLAGAIGGVGIAVLAPTVGLGAGLKQGGILGGVVGLTGGAVIGVVGGAALVVGGAVSGVAQMVRGVLAAPKAVMAPRQGKWWNESTHEWVYTDLVKEIVPDNDDDILKHLRDELDAAGKVKPGDNNTTVKDTYYYDILEVDPQADASAIKRRYYILARKYHPDRVENESDKQEATDKFKDIAEAYQVLSDPELRQTYDQDGKDALSGDKTSVNATAPDPQMLFAFLFGSDRFQPYIGRLATATSAMIGDSPKLGMKDARELQHRRCTRLAKTLAEKLANWVLAEEVDLCITMWETEAIDLSTASYGLEMVRTIGMVYELTALQFLGSTENGLGMPSITKWAQAQSARMQKNKAKSKTSVDSLMAGIDMMKLQAEMQQKMAAAKTDEERDLIQQEMQTASSASLLKIMWTTTVVDITSTLHEVCQMIFFDQSVDKAIRKQRALGLQKLGQVFQACPPPEGQEDKDAKTLYEEAAFAAMLETIKRKDEAAHAAGSSY